MDRQQLEDGEARKETALASSFNDGSWFIAHRTIPYHDTTTYDGSSNSAQRLHTWRAEQYPWTGAWRDAATLRDTVPEHAMSSLVSARGRDGDGGVPADPPAGVSYWEACPAACTSDAPPATVIVAGPCLVPNCLVLGSIMYFRFYLINII
jgi:hypothetical protein